MALRRHHLCLVKATCGPKKTPIYVLLRPHVALTRHQFKRMIVSSNPDEIVEFYEFSIYFKFIQIKKRFFYKSRNFPIFSQRLRLRLSLI